MNPKDVAKLITEDEIASLDIAEPFRVEEKDGIYRIYHDDKLIKTTSDFSLVERLEFVEDIVGPHGLQGWKQLREPITTYKGTPTPGRAIPGYTTTDPMEAKIYHGNGEWGGEYLVRIKADRSRSKTTEAHILWGREGSVVFLPGVPDAIIRGSEVVLLRPEDQESYEP